MFSFESMPSSLAGETCVSLLTGSLGSRLGEDASHRFSVSVCWLCDGMNANPKTMKARWIFDLNYENSSPLAQLAAMVMEHDAGLRLLARL